MGSLVARAFGDLLVLCTHGVTEATDSADEEFGDRGLVSLILENRSLGAEELTQKVLSIVTQFSRGNLTDDATLLVPRTE